MNARKWSRASSAVAWLAQAVYLTDVMLVALIVFLIAITGKDPFQSVGMAIAIGVCAAVLVFHRAWAWRRRDDGLAAIARHTARERRGF